MTATPVQIARATIQRRRPRVYFDASMATLDRHTRAGTYSEPDALRLLFNNARDGARSLGAMYDARSLHSAAKLLLQFWKDRA